MEKQLSESKKQKKDTKRQSKQSMIEMNVSFRYEDGKDIE